MDEPVRPATAGDIAEVVRIAVAGFHDDPVMSWALPDPATRAARLTTVFAMPAGDMLGGGTGTVHLCDRASVALWRDPSYEHGTRGPGAVDDEAAAAFGVFEPGELERLAVLGAAMEESHPHEPHWYLNILATVPARQGQGIGARVLAPVLERCDADGVRAYLESTNPRNHAFYHRLGFVDAGEIALAGGPSLLAMWRDPRP